MKKRCQIDRHNPSDLKCQRRFYKKEFKTVILFVLKVQFPMDYRIRTFRTRKEAMAMFIRLHKFCDNVKSNMSHVWLYKKVTKPQTRIVKYFGVRLFKVLLSSKSKTIMEYKPTID